jgi:hypothetical protein
VSFSSASARPTKSSELERRTTLQSDDDTLSDRTHLRDRFFKERDNDRLRDRPGFSSTRRSAKEEGESWIAKGRHSFGPDDSDRILREGERDRDRSFRNGDADTSETPRRMGFGRGRGDQSWTRDREDAFKDGNDNPRFGGGKNGGWRERERERERERNDRDWNRSARTEETPEWMDVEIKKESKSTHTADDFQRWKDQMKAKAGGVPLKDAETNIEQPKPKETQPSTSSAPSQQTPATPLTIDPEKMFGMWGDAKSKEPVTTETSAAAKTQTAKPKVSKFASLWTPAEEKPQHELAPSISPPPTSSTSNEDKEGFQRILQMLGNTSVSTPPPSMEQKASNGLRQPSILDNLLGPSQDIAERQKARPPSMKMREDRDGLLEAALSSRTPVDLNAPQNAGLSTFSMEHSFNIAKGMRSDIGRDDLPHQPPSRNGNSQLPPGLSPHDNAPQRDVALSRDREFLLNLMQQPSRSTPQMQEQGLPRPAHESNLPLFLEAKDPVQAARSVPPPGLSSGAPMNDRDRMMRRDLEAQLQQHEMMRKNQHQHNSNMNAFYDEPGLPPLQRRNTNPAESANPQRLQMASNLGIPSQPLPDAQWLRNQGMPNPHNRIAPPPGFDGRVPQPPGFGGPQPIPYGGNNPMAPPGLRGPHPGPNGPGGPGNSMFPQMPPPLPPGQGFPFPGGNRPGNAPPPGFGLLGMQQDAPPLRGMNGRPPMAPPGFDPFGEMGRGGPTGRGGPFPPGQPAFGL